MRHLSLFSGLGATDLAAERCGFQTVATAEIDDWLNGLLRVRFPRATQYADVADVRGRGRGPDVFDLVSGGFPCPDIANPGTQLGLQGVRSGLWGEFARIIREIRPRYVLAENVAALKVRGLNVVLNDLWHAGYSVAWDCIPAAAYGAPHLRDRIWIKGVQGSHVRPVQGTLIGQVGQAGAGITYWGQSVSKLPRAGTVDSMGVVRETEPRAPVRLCRQNYPLLDIGVGAWRDRPLMPTPTLSDGTGGPGTTPKRKGGMNLRTWVAVHRMTGPLNPAYLEWMMGLPIGWSNPELSNDQLEPHGGWWREPRDIEPVDPGKVPHRRARLRALGNALVPQVAEQEIQSLVKGAIP